MTSDVVMLAAALLALAGTIISARWAHNASRAAAAATVKAAEEAAAATRKAARDAADAARGGSEPDRITALGGRLDAALERMDEQDETVGQLRSEVGELRARIREDTEVRHKLKNALVYVIGVLRQALRAIIDTFTDDQVTRLPQPLRDDVTQQRTYEEYLELAKARDQQ